MLPCPYCGEREDIDIIGHAYDSWSTYCNNCVTEGPEQITEELAIKAWNALPRKLQWTHEKPTVPGYYWIHAPSTGNTKICEVEKQNGAMCFRLLYDWRTINILPKDTKWAGPIPMPEDAK